MGGVINLESGWNDLTEEISVPMDIGAAIATGRSELIVFERPLNKAESRQVLHAFGVMIETNHRLKERGLALAKRVVAIQDNMKGIERSLALLRKYAEGAEIPAEDE